MAASKFDLESSIKCNNAITFKVFQEKLSFLYE